MINKLLAVAFVALAVAASGCGSSSSSSSSTPPASSGGAADCSPASLQTLTSGKLTIGTDNPAYSPYFTGGPGHDWSGQYNNDPYTGKGFEDAVAYAVAEKMGFTKDQVTWAVTHFDQSFAPGPKNFDFYLAQVSIRPKRAENVDFSLPYYRANQAVVALKGTPITSATTLADLKQYKLGTQVGTTSYDFITGTIQPSQQPSAFNTTNDAIHALQAGQIDGIVVDLPTAFYMTGGADPQEHGGRAVPDVARRRPVGAGDAEGQPAEAVRRQGRVRAHGRRDARQAAADLAVRQGQHPGSSVAA